MLLHCNLQMQNSMSHIHRETYPPLFRQALDPNTIISRVDSQKPSNPDLESDYLPLLDLTNLNQLVLSEACKDWGIFRLVNHGIPMSLMKQLHEEAKRVFNLEFEVKKEMLKSPLSYFWGTPALTPSGVALQGQSLNWVEGFNIPLTQLPLLQSQDSLHHSFRLLLEEYGKHQSRIAKIIYEAMIENLEVGKLEESNSHLSTSSGIIRVYRYPALCSVAANKLQLWGMGVHTDSSILSILNQDQVGGLQIFKDNQWLDVIPIPDTLIIHLGDMMQVISNDKYKSVLHRVQVNKTMERISIGYFVFPEEHSIIKSTKYKPFSYADFRGEVQEDLKTIGFKVGLQRFKLTCDKC